MSRALALAVLLAIAPACAGWQVRPDEVVGEAVPIVAAAALCTTYLLRDPPDEEAAERCLVAVGVEGAPALLATVLPGGGAWGVEHLRALLRAISDALTPAAAPCPPGGP